MSDEVKGESLDTSQWNVPDQEVEVIIDEDQAEEDVPEEFKDQSKSDIIKRLKEVEDKQTESTKMSDALAQLATAQREQKIVMQPSQPAAAPAKPPTLDELRETYGEKFTMDPIGTVMELQNQKMSPQIQQMATGNLQLARKVMELDPEKGPTFKKYSNEIDGMVASAPPEIRTNPMIYEEAYKRVVTNHMDEILNERVAKAVEAKMAEVQGQKSDGSKPASTFTEGRGLAQPTKRITVRMSQAQLDRLKTLGIDPKDYAGAMGGSK